jgi:soluble lytic murein transglycosylase-like protein
MPTTLPPIPSDQWDQHVETTSQERYASDLASIDRARAAQQQAEAHRVANDARDEADAQQRASAQIEAIGIAQSRNQEEVDAQRQAAAQIDAIRPPEMPQAPAPQPSSAPTDVGGTDWRAYAAQAAQRAGIDPGMFQRQIQQESGFDPNARSGAGAQGIAQIVPSAHPGVNPLDPKASLDYAANWMRSLVDRYGGDARKALAAYNAGPGAVDKYGGVPPFEETQRYVRTIYDEGGQASPLEPPTTPGAQSSQYATARAPGRVEAVGQFEQGLPYEEAVAICGPVAALAFAKANGRNPDLAEVRALATGRGWTSTGGMNGIANEQATLTDLGVKSRLDTNPDFGHIAQDAASGNPVIISTPVHYYYANNYDPATGKIFVGKTGTRARAAGRG